MLRVASIAVAVLAVGACSMDYGAKTLSGQGLVAFGDSFTLGMGASDQPHWYISRLTGYVGGSVNNQAISGTGTSESAKALFAAAPLVRKTTVTVLSGFNDIGREGSDSIPRIAANHRAMIAAAFLRDAVPASAAPRSSGVWIPLGASAGGKSFALGGTPMYSDTAGAYLEFDFYGETLVVGAYTQIASGYYDDLNVSIDGAAASVYRSLGLNNEPYPAVGYNAAVYRNLGSGKHTVRLSGVNSGSKHTVVDYIGTLIDPAAAYGLVIGEIPTRVNWTAGTGFVSSQAMTDAANSAIDCVVGQFPEYPVRVVPIEEFYSAADVGTDGIHPSDTGHLHIYQAFRSQISLW